MPTKATAGCPIRAEDHRHCAAFPTPTLSAATVYALQWSRVGEGEYAGLSKPLSIHLDRLGPPKRGCLRSNSSCIRKGGELLPNTRGKDIAGFLDHPPLLREAGSGHGYLTGF